jgi:hypothetical protein
MRRHDGHLCEGVPTIQLINMNESEFRRLVQNGHGRAVLYARSHGLSGFRDVLLDESLHCNAVDPVCEGTRADFISGLLEYLPDRRMVEDAVLDSLGPGEDSWHAVQRFEFARYMVEEGRAQARQRIYDCFNPGPAYGAHIARGIISLDALNGSWLIGSAQSCSVASSISTLDGSILQAAKFVVSRRTGTSCAARADRIPALLRFLRLQPPIHASMIWTRRLVRNEGRK